MALPLGRVRRDGETWALDDVAPYPELAVENAVTQVYPSLDTETVTHLRWFQPTALRSGAIVALEALRFAGERALVTQDTLALAAALTHIESRLAVTNGQGDYCPPSQGDYADREVLPTSEFERREFDADAYAFGNAVWHLDGTAWAALVNGGLVLEPVTWAVWSGGGFGPRDGDAAETTVGQVVAIQARGATPYLPAADVRRLFAFYNQRMANHTQIAETTLADVCAVVDETNHPGERNAGECFCGQPHEDWATATLLHAREYAIDPGQRDHWLVPRQYGDLHEFGQGTDPATILTVDAGRWYVVGRGVQGSTGVFVPLGLYRAPIGNGGVPSPPWTRIYEEPAHGEQSAWNARPDVAASRRAVWLREVLADETFSEETARVLRFDKATDAVQIVMEVPYGGTADPQVDQLFPAWQAKWR